MSTKGIGRLIQFGVAKETVRGTANSSADFWLPWQEHAIEEKDARVMLDQANGVIEDGVGETIAKQWAEAEVTVPVDDLINPLFLISLLGTNTPAANVDASGVVYDNTITVAQNHQHQSLSLYSDDPLAGADYKFALGVVDSYELDYQAGKFVTAKIKLRSKKGTTTTNTPSASTIYRFLGHHMTFKTASTYAGLGAASAVVIRGCKIKIENNIEDDFNLGSLAPSDFVNKAFSISGSFDILYSAETYTTPALAGTTAALRFDLVNTDVTIGTSANPRTRIDLAKVLYGTPSRAIKLGDMVMQTVPFKAYYSAGDSLMVSILCTNLQNGY